MCQNIMGGSFMNRNSTTWVPGAEKSRCVSPAPCGPTITRARSKSEMTSSRGCPARYTTSSLSGNSSASVCRISRSFATSRLLEPSRVQ